MSIFIRDVGAATSKITTHPKASNGTLGTSDVGSDGIEDGQRTPAGEAIFFFETSPATDAQPVQLYELRLDEDGAPSKDKAACAPTSALMSQQKLTYIISTFDCPHLTSHMCFEYQ